MIVPEDNNKVDARIKNYKPVKLLLIGGLPPPIGGGQQVFKYLVDDLTNDTRCKVRVINTSRPDAAGTFFENIKVGSLTFIKLLTNIQTVDVVSFHADPRGFLFFGPLCSLVCLLFRKPRIYRFIGGGFDSFFMKKNKFIRWIIMKTILSAEVCLFQTKHLCNYFKKLGLQNIFWFSNYTRNILPIPTQLPSKSCNRFVFLGHIMRSKGIDIILDAAPNICNDVTIDLYGPLMDGYKAEDIEFRGCGRVHYCGVLTKDEVFKKLWSYDALIHPTCHPTEGYPGAIIEGFSHGLPVITTRWRSVPEIVDDTCGILIEPGDINGFARAVNLLHMDVKLFSKLRIRTYAQAQLFSDVYWTNYFIELLEALHLKQLRKKNIKNYT